VLELVKKDAFRAFSSVKNASILFVLDHEGLFSKIVAGQRCVSYYYNYVIMAGCENLGSQILTGGHGAGK